MAKRNKVYELPDNLIEKANSLIVEGKLNISQIADFLNSHELNNGIEISHSGLGRYKKSFEAMRKEFQALDNLVKSLPKEVDFSKENDLHQLLYKILHKAMLDVSFGKELKPSEIMLLAKASKDLMSGAKDREKIKLELRKEIKAETLQKVEQVAIKAGISKKGIKIIKEALKD